MTESELIEKSKAGDVEAFSQLIRNYENKIFSLAHHVCAGMPSDAEDVYQETFLSAFKNIKGFKNRSNLGTWLYRIAANLCWVRFRKKKRDPVMSILDRNRTDENGIQWEFKDWFPNPEEISRKKELQEAVAKALSELPSDYRLVLTLRDIEGLSAEETAKILKLSIPAVKSRLHRGRIYLRERFEEEFKEKAK
jgi:RNA polymerase sigma-70 factor (ECF subfamily)